MTNTIIITVEQNSADQATIVLGDGSGTYNYGIFTAPIKKAANSLRQSLSNLRSVWLQTEHNFDDALATVAERGADLYEAFFIHSLPTDQSTSDEAKSWFEELTSQDDAQHDITAFADPQLPIPWGLIYQKREDDDLYSGFWAIRYRVAAVYNKVVPQRLGRPRPRENVRLLSGLNQTAFEAAREHIDATTQTYIDMFLQQPVGLAFTTKGCKEQWRKAHRNDCVIHFFGHASGTELRFSDTDRLTPTDFRKTFQRESSVVHPRTTPVYALSLLNGCETVSGEGAEGFLLATAYPGFCGFIGPEAEIPDRFAILFGQEFLYALLVEGESVRDAMGRLWKKHRPMGLFYGCYAQPTFRVTGDKKFPPLPSSFNNPNFHPPTPSNP